jgi:hypothetical protein
MPMTLFVELAAYSDRWVAQDAPSRLTWNAAARRV